MHKTKMESNLSFSILVDGVSYSTLKYGAYKDKNKSGDSILYEETFTTEDDKTTSEKKNWKMKGFWKTNKATNLCYTHHPRTLYF